MAGAESGPPEREKKTRRNAPVEGAIFFPSVVGSGKLAFWKPYRSKFVFAYVIGYGRGKSSFLAHVLGYGRGKNSRHPAAAPQKKNCVFSQVRTGKKFGFAHVIGYGREKQRVRWVFFWRSLLPVRARPPSSQIGPKKPATGKESTRTRSFSRPCWRTLFLLLLWKYVKGVSPFGSKLLLEHARPKTKPTSEKEQRQTRNDEFKHTH